MVNEVRVSTITPSKKPTNRFIITDFNRCKGEQMNSIEFEKPENWSIGQRTGFLSILLLVLGPMILFFLDSIFKSYSLFVAVVTIILMVSLLYTKTNIFLERGGIRRRINPFILLVWGAWQFYSYFGLVAYYMTYPFGHVPYTLITGLWLTAIGFLLCMITGIMEWKCPLVMGPRVLFGRKSVGMVPAEKGYKPEVRTKPVQPPVRGVTVTGIPGPKPAVKVTANPGNPHSATNISEIKPTSKDEKILLRWARHIGADGQAYEQCMKCGKYGFITARESEGNMLFSCPSCETVFKLKK